MEELESAPVIKSEVLDTVPTLRSEISAPRSRSRSGRGPAAEDAYNLHPVSVSRGGDLVGGAEDGIKQGGAPEFKDVDTMEMQMLNAPDLDTSCGRDLVRGVAGGGGAPNKRRTTSWGTTSFYDNVAAKPSLVSGSTTTAVGSDWKYASNTSTSSSYFAPPTSATASSSTIKATSSSRTTTRTNRYFYESAGSGFNCSSSTSQQHAGEDGAAGRGAGLDVEGKEVFAGDDRHEQGGDDTNGVVAEVDDIKQDDDDDLRDSKWSSSVAGAGNDYDFAPGWGGSRRGRDVDKAAERERDKKKGYAAAGAGAVLYNKSWAEKETDEYFCWGSGWDYAYGGGPSSWSNAKASDGDETQEESSAKKQYNSTSNSYDKNYAYEGGGSGGSASWHNKNDYDSSSGRGGAGSGKPSSYYAAGYDSFNAFDHSWGGKTSSHPSSSGDRSNAGKQGKTKGSSSSATFYSSDVDVEPSHRYSNDFYGNGAYGKAANLARKGKSKKGAAAGRENSSSYAYGGAGDYIHNGTSLTSFNAGAPSYGHGHASSAAGAANFSSGRGYNGHDSSSSTWGGVGSGGSSHKHGEKSSWNAHGGKDKNGKEQHHSYGKEGCYAKDSHTNYGKDAYPDGKEQQGHNYAGGGKQHSSSKTSGGKHQMSGTSYNKGAMSKGAAYYAYASKAGKGGGDRKDFYGENGANDSDGKGERDRDVSNSCGKLFAPRPGKGKVLPPPPPLRSRSRSGAGGRDDDREGKGGTTPTPKGRRRSSVVSQAPPGLEDVVSGAADPLEDKLLDEEFLSPQDLLVLEDVNTSSQHQHQIKTPALEELGTTGEDPPPPTAAARDKAVAGDHLGRELDEDQAGGGHHEADVVEGPTWSTDGSAVHWSSYYECNTFQNSEKKDIEGRSGESSDKGVLEKLHEQGDGVADSGSASTGNKGGGRGGAPPGGGGKTKGQFVIKGSSKATYTSAWGTYQASHSQWKGIGKGRATNKNYNAGKGARSDHGGESYHGASSSGGAGKEHQGTSKGKGKGEQDQQQYSNYTNAYAGLANRHGTASRYGSSQSTYYSSLSEYYGGSGGGGKDKEKDYNGGAGAGHGHGQHGSNSASGVLAGTTSASGQNIDDSDTAATASGKMGRGGKGDRLVHASAEADANACQNYSAKQASENYSHSVYKTSSAAASYHQNHAPNHYGQHHGSSYHHDHSSSNYEEGGGAAAQYSNYGRGSSRGGGRDEREKFSSCYSTYGGPEGVAASSGADSKTTAGASSNTTSGGGGGGAGGVIMGDVLSSVAPTSIRRGVSAAAPYVNTYNASATQIRTTSTSAASAGNISAGTATRGKSVSPSKKNAQHNLPHPKNVSGYHYNYPEGHLDYVPATFDLDMRPGSQWDREQMRRVPKVSPYKDFDFAILRTCIWRYCGYDVEAMRRKTGNSLRYQNYKADCVAFLRFLLSQEPANCEWKLGYLLAMCLKHDHEMLAIATSSRNIGEKERNADLRAVVGKSGDLDRAIAEAPERNATHVEDTGSNDLSTLSILAATPAGAAKKKSVGSGGTGDAAKGSLARAEQEAEASCLETGADVDDTPALSSIQGASRIEMNITPAVTKTDSLVVVGDGEVVGTETTRELLANASSPSPHSKLAQNDGYKPPSTSPSIAGAGAGLVLPQTSTSSKMKDDEFLQLDEEPEQVGGPGQLEQTPNTTNTNSKMIKDLASQASVLEGVLDSQMFSLLTQLFIQDSRAHAVHELESIFFQMGSRKKNSHVLAAMIRGYGCKGYWMSSLKLFLHARERTLEQESKDYEYRYLCYQAALDWALHNENSFMTYTVLRFCQIDGVPIRYPGGVLPHHQHQLHPAAAGAGAAGGQLKFYYEQLGGGMKTNNTTTSSTSGGAPATGGVDFVRWPVEELRFAFPDDLGLGAPKIRYYTSPSVPEARLAGTYKPLPTHQIMENPSLVEKEFEVLYLDAGLDALGQESGSNAKQRRTAGAAAAAAGAPQQEHQLHDHSQDPKQRGRGGPLEVEGGINGVIGGHADELLEREHEHHHYNTSATYNDQYNAYEPIYYPIYAGAHHEDYGGHYDYQHHDTGRGEQELPQHHVELGYSLLVHDNGTGVLAEEHHGSYLHLEPLEHDQHHHHLHATSPPPYGEVDPGQVGDHLHQQHGAAHPFGASELVSAYLGGSADPHVVDHHLIYQSAGGGYHVGAAGSLAPAEFELELDPYTDQPSGLELMHELYHYGAAAAASATQEGQEAQDAPQQTVAV